MPREVQMTAWFSAKIARLIFKTLLDEIEKSIKSINETTQEIPSVLDTRIGKPFLNAPFPICAEKSSRVIGL